MAVRSTLTGFLALAVSAGPLVAAEAALLAPGAYLVDVRLELPNLDGMTAKRTETVCILPAGPSGEQGLAVLSDNNPLARCPVLNVHRDGNVLTFDIECPGGNAARASARFTLASTAFEGRIRMKMGGKNMTMTETQAGTRVGDCPPAASGPSSPGL